MTYLKRKNFVLYFIVVFLFFISCSNNSTNSSAPSGGGNGTSPKEVTVTYSTICQYGDNPSLDIDSNGNPHVSFIDRNDKKIKYAFKQDNIWDLMAIEYIPNLFTSMGVNGISVDSKNSPHVIYDFLNDSTPLCYRYAEMVAQNFQITTINLPKDPVNPSYNCIPNYYSSICVNKITDESHVLLSFLSTSIGGLAYWKTGMANSIIIAPSDYQTEFILGKNAITLDNSGNPHICYIERDNGTDYLKYAWFDGNSFNFETIDTVSATWSLPTIELDNNNNPHVAYLTGILYHAYKSNNTWVKEVVINGGWEEPNFNFSLDNNGMPHFIFEDAGGSLYYRYWNNINWVDKIISDEICGANAIKVDRKTGKVHIVYTEGLIDWYLKYALVE
ncbi:MAG: hypothetical protein KA120_01370 [Candidatus Goldbacteria bacterium]|nr:hypothetical protein [Candidatus Goldiibacteriota bacterium]